MAAVSQTTLSNAFSWMKMPEFRWRFHWSLSLRVQLTIIQHWFRSAPSHYLNQWWLVYWRIYASLSLNELTQISPTYPRCACRTCCSIPELELWILLQPGQVHLNTVRVADCKKERFMVSEEIHWFIVLVDAIMHQLTWPKLPEAMACCLLAPSHYLNQCWLIFDNEQMVQWIKVQTFLIHYGTIMT